MVGVLRIAHTRCGPNTSIADALGNFAARETRSVADRAECDVRVNGVACPPAEHGVSDAVTPKDATVERERRPQTIVRLRQYAVFRIHRTPPPHARTHRETISVCA